VSSSAGESGQGPGENAIAAARRKSELDPGTVVNGIYRLVRLVGIGGMGEVWEARHERTKGRVALKLLLPEMGRHDDVLLRFQREVELTSRLNHPNIVRVSDADTLPNGRPFLVMEFLDGHDLAKLTGRPMPFGDVADIIEQTAMGLQAAHGQSIIHRDLKPANIFVVPLPGRSRALIKILDFGISKAVDGLSKLTQTHSVMGTPSYMAPEQARGGSSSMDARADQFSLAAIAYELLTGRMPFAGDGTLNVLYKVVLEQPPTFASFGIAVAPEVEAVVLRGMSKTADARFGSVLEFSDALKAAGGAGGERGIASGSSGRPLASGPAGAVSLSGFAAPGGTLAVPRAVAAGAGRPGSAGALATPRTLRMPGNPETTLGGSTGEFAAAAAPDTLARKASMRRTLGLAMGVGGVVAVVVAVVALRQSLGGSDRVTHQPPSPDVTTSSRRPASASVPVTPTGPVQVAPPAPVPLARRVAAPPLEASVPSRSTPSHPASSRVKTVVAKTVMRAKPENGKAKRPTRATSHDAQAQPPDASPPASKTVQQPGPLNGDL
jgi:eukaryotic-like serine/threonine-protein kinase